MASDDQALDSGGANGNGNVALSIRSRGHDDVERGVKQRAAGAASAQHSRHSSDEDSRGLRKGTKRLWAMRAAKWLLSLAVVLALVNGLMLLRRDDRSSALTVVLPFIAINDKASAEFGSADGLSLAAIASWLQLLQPALVVAYAASDAACAALTAAFPGVQCYHLPHCVSSSSPLPTLPCVLSHLLSTAVTAPTIALLSPQQAIDRRLLDATVYVSAHLPPSQRDLWLMAGHRTDVGITAQAVREYDRDDFVSRLWRAGKESGRRQREQPVDGLILTRRLLAQLLDSMPPFLAGAGQASSSSWLFATALLNSSAAVVDMTLAASLLQLQLVDDALTSPLQSLRSDSAHNDGAAQPQYLAPAASHNHELLRRSVGARGAVARLTYSPFILEGDCPEACVVSPNPDSRWKNALLFTRRVNAEGYLAVLTVNSGYLALAVNWLCWAERIGFRHFVLLAEDRRAAQALQSESVAVITRPRAPLEKAAAEYGSVEFQETMTYRTEFLLDVLEAGYHFMTADMDAVWLSDPLPHLDLQADLSGQTHKKTKLSGGLVVVRATEAGKSFWREVIKCQRGNALFLSEHTAGSYEPSMYTEQYCINQLSLQQPPAPAFTRSLLDPWLFPDGLSFFEQLQPQHAGVVPVVIHNNWIRGTDSKLRRLRDWGLTSTDDSNTRCVPIPAPPAPLLAAPQPAAPAGFSLIIRVLARAHPAELSRLLGSLSSLSCPGCGPVRLQLDVDRVPEVEDDGIEQTVARHATYLELLDIANKFQWPQGEKEVRESKRRRGRLGQWLDGWLQQPQQHPDNRTLYLLLDERCAVSGELLRWLAGAVSAYYLQQETADSRMIGIQLEREDVLLLETYWARFPHRLTAALLPPEVRLYRYQSLSPYAQLMFPSSLQRFTAWVDARALDHATSLPPATTNNHITPCVPLLVSNRWYQPQGDHQQLLRYDTEDVWWVWMQRWMYEEGLYSLVTNWQSALALVTHPEGRSGPFLRAANASVPAVTLLPSSSAASAAAFNFPHLSSLPVYSFAFGSPLTSSSLLSVLPLLTPSTPSPSSQCVSAADYEAEQAARVEAEERKKAEEELRARAAAESKAKRQLSDKMRKGQRGAPARHLPVAAQLALCCSLSVCSVSVCVYREEEGGGGEAEEGGGGDQSAAGEGAACCRAGRRIKPPKLSHSPLRSTALFPSLPRWDKRLACCTVRRCNRT